MKKIQHKIINNIKCKRCGHCKQWLPLDNFPKNKTRWDNLDNECKKCRKEFKIKNKEHIKKQAKQYHTKNREHILQQKRQYRKNNPNKDKQYYIKNKEHIKKQAKQYRVTKAKYKPYHKQLAFCEEIRQHPKNPELLQVKCTYCGCWFTPISAQVQDRIKAINKSTIGEHRFYCSNSCKLACPIFEQKKWPKNFKQATSREVVPLLRQLVLKRDNWTCQMCGATTKTAQLHVHHIIPYAQNKMQANDPDSCITLCKECHKKVHKQNGCKYSDLRCKNK